MLKGKGCCLSAWMEKDRIKAMEIGWAAYSALSEDRYFSQSCQASPESAK